MTTHLLGRKTHRDGPDLSLGPDIDLPLARLHEACGAARRIFALWLAYRLEGPVFWISPRWLPEQLHPEGVVPFIEPERLILVKADKPEDLLACMEESLRAGHVPLVVADIPAPPSLTAVRRLHLAAETGAEATRAAPLGVILTPGEGGAMGVEARWRMEPRFDPDTPSWELTRLRARTAPVKRWKVSGLVQAPRFDPLPAPG
ncbi:hypothetical protein Q8W25_07065 [Shimia thalassica]|uniref:ImuA family protein n=1 Tax=Shimia thalassica TaxID=1715693 RepID=UPI001C09D966|nr:hypothetical protein [Shimia thalassica]MBU2942159.1 hypothetical protein [Shimia thalassica]MDO6478359.1 hypothetical protein [Shimia thalassica]MDO6482822.1 hypothetical protein [Shimia thalassica]MDO6502871.1 hypothetical protein [Shimia thalassica]MDP2493769.1 hypothetical protein [Shimia thalassica]